MFFFLLFILSCPLVVTAPPAEAKVHFDAQSNVSSHSGTSLPSKALDDARLPAPVDGRLSEAELRAEDKPDLARKGVAAVAQPGPDQVYDELVDSRPDAKTSALAMNPNSSGLPWVRLDKGMPEPGQIEDREVDLAIKFVASPTQDVAAMSEADLIDDQVTEEEHWHRYSLPPRRRYISPRRRYIPPPRRRYIPPSPPRRRYNPPSPPRRRYIPPTPPRRRYIPPSPPRRRYNPPSPPRRRFFPPSPPPRRRYSPPSPPRRRFFPPSPPPRRRYIPPSPPRRRIFPPSPPPRRRRYIPPDMPRRRYIPDYSPRRRYIPDYSPRRRSHPRGGSDSIDIIVIIVIILLVAVGICICSIVYRAMANQ